MNTQGLDSPCDPPRRSQSAMSICRAFDGLVSVDLSGTGVTDDGVQLVLGAQGGLRFLGLRDMPGLTDRGLGAVLECIKRRKRLRELRLCRSLRFSDPGKRGIPNAWRAGSMMR